MATLASYSSRDYFRANSSDFASAGELAEIRDQGSFNLYQWGLRTQRCPRMRSENIARNVYHVCNREIASFRLEMDL